MTDIAFCQTKTDQLLRKISYFYEWLIHSVTFARAKGQIPSIIVTIQRRQLTNKDDSILTYLAAAASFQRLQALKLKIYSFFAAQGSVLC